MTLRPTKLELAGDDRLRIEWNDGVTREYGFSELRKCCPCATCREHRKAPAEQGGLLPVLSAAEAQPLRILGMEPVGNYAYSINFSDGHDTGIFQFELLRELGSVLPPSEQVPGAEK
jgi:DUF971 family protein